LYCKCLCDSSNHFHGLHNLKSHIESKECPLNPSFYSEAFNTLFKSVYKLFNFIAQDQKLIDSQNSKWLKFASKPITQTDCSDDFINKYRFRVSGSKDINLVLFPEFTGEQCQVTRNIRSLKEQLDFLSNSY
jgi:hypothetical protein